jgi:hypothetical protein
LTGKRFGTGETNSSSNWKLSRKRLPEQEHLENIVGSLQRWRLASDFGDGCF